MTKTLSRPRKIAAVLAAAVVTAAGVSACSSSSGKKVFVVGYSVPAPAYTAVGDAFAKTSDGKDVSLSPTFGPSGTESKAVLGGQKADVVNFSTPGDLTALVPSKVDASWDQGPTKGYITKSVVVIVVRKGNPLGIKGWDDLIKPGVKIVTPVPSTSGSAKWNILAAYEHVIANGGTAAQATAYLKSFLANVDEPAGQRFRGHPAVHQRHRQRADLLRVRGHPGQAGRQVDRLHRPRPDGADREPGRRHQGRLVAGQGVPDLRRERGGPGDLREQGLPAGAVRRQGRHRGRAPTTRATRSRPRPT